MHMICWAVSVIVQCFIQLIIATIKLIVVAKLHHYRNCPGGCITAHQRVNYRIFIYCLAVIVHGDFCTHALLSS